MLARGFPDPGGNEGSAIVGSSVQEICTMVCFAFIIPRCLRNDTDILQFRARTELGIIDSILQFGSPPRDRSGPLRATLDLERCTGGS